MGWLMSNRTLALLCLAGGAIAFAIAAVLIFQGFEKWGYYFIVLALAAEFFLAFLFEYLERRATKRRPLQEVLPPERQPVRRVERLR